MSTLIKPTQQQSAILGCKSPVVVIEAAAGTGKTSTLAMLAGQSIGKGIDPRQILVLTKTDAAIVAMRSTLKRLGVSSSHIKAMRIETIEEFSRRILARFECGFVPLVDALNHLADHAWTAMVRTIETTPPRIQADFRIPSNSGKSRDDDWIEDFFMLSRRFKGGLHFLDDEGDFWRAAEIADEPNVMDLHAALWFRDYIRHVRCAGFGDAPPAFRSEGDASYDLARYRRGGHIPPGSPAVSVNFSLVLLDEMHDLNEATYEVIKLLMSENCAENCQLVGVGDRNQVIYEYDAADDRFMNADVLESDLQRPVTTLELTLSFRFGQELSQAVNRIFPGKCQSRQGTAASVELETYKNIPSNIDQPLLNVLQRYKNNKEGESRLAIVLRHPCQSFAIENTLIGEGLSYEVSGLASCFDWPEIMLIRGIVAVGGQRVTDAADSEKVRRGIIRAFDEFARPSYPELALTQNGVRSREEFVQMAMQNAAASEQVVWAFMNGTLLKSGYCDQVVVRRLAAAIEQVELKGNQVTVAEIVGALEIERLLAHAFVSVRRRNEARANLETLKAVADQHGSVAAFFQHLNLQEKKREAIDRKNQNQKHLAHRQSALRLQQTAISLFNVDVVKGLEFSDVYLPCANRGEFPAHSAPAKEERNRFYVALSRAKERLTVSARSGHENDWFLAQANSA